MIIMYVTAGKGSKGNHRIYHWIEIRNVSRDVSLNIYQKSISDMQRQTTVTSWLKSKQLLLFAFTRCDITWITNIKNNI